MAKHTTEQAKMPTSRYVPPNRGGTKLDDEPRLETAHLGRRTEPHRFMQTTRKGRWTQHDGTRAFRQRVAPCRGDQGRGPVTLEFAHLLAGTATPHSTISAITDELIGRGAVGPNTSSWSAAIATDDVDTSVQTGVPVTSARAERGKTAT
jgi:hypothetical protein